METTIYIVVTVLCGVLFLIPTIAVFKLFYTIVTDMSLKEAPFIGIVGVVLFAAFCIVCATGTVKCTSAVANSFFGKPKPSNIIELDKDGVKYNQYQDTTHMCNASDKESPWFISMIPAGSEASRYDICLNCHRSFANHFTYFEHGLFTALGNASTYP